VRLVDGQNLELWQGDRRIAEFRRRHYAAAARSSFASPRAAIFNASSGSGRSRF
jgi:hypothetical protein